MKNQDEFHKHNVHSGTKGCVLYGSVRIKFKRTEVISAVRKQSGDHPWEAGKGRRGCGGWWGLTMFLHLGAVTRVCSLCGNPLTCALVLYYCMHSSARMLYFHVKFIENSVKGSIAVTLLSLKFLLIMRRKVFCIIE